MELNELSSTIIGAAITVHKELGPGLLESVYHRCLVIELRALGLRVETEVPVPVTYRGQCVSDDALRMDLLVEDLIVVELKSVSRVEDIHCKQLLTYLRLTRTSLGLLINFNVSLLKDGLTRIINTPKAGETDPMSPLKTSGQSPSVPRRTLRETSSES